jgi:23S rRNA (guanine745-N1)-methyltransferase
VTAALLCSVRGCGFTLERRGASYGCASGHLFDVARSGYVNLLQPQDARSRRPGDSAEALAARRRCFERGLEAHVLEAVVDEIGALRGPRETRVLDVGCGEGQYLAALAARSDSAAYGLDISTRAIDRAARSIPNATLVVANADRRIPFAGGSFDVVLSVTARRNAAEFRRVLASDGSAVVVVPAADDLVELREAVLGERVVASRVERVVEELATHFSLARHREARLRVLLGPDAIRDALAATYRAARRSERRLAEDLDEAEVTFARDVLTFRCR